MQAPQCKARAKAWETERAPRAQAIPLEAARVMTYYNQLLCLTR